MRACQLSLAQAVRLAWPPRPLPLLGRYILRRSGRLHTGTPRQLTTAPLTRLPLWMVHTERGDVSQGQKDLAALLPMPCYGLAMGADAGACASVADMAEHYCRAILALQPAGPYLVLGSSIAGAAVADAIVSQLRGTGQRAGLLILDGCVGRPTVPLHDANW